VYKQTQDLAAKCMREMIRTFAADPRRVGHFLKVYGFAMEIAAGESLTQEEELSLALAALTHDIGIRIGEAKYNSNAPAVQEREGPAAARALLASIGVSEEVTGKVCAMIAVHHTYSAPRDICLQILMEADFLVNAYEDEMSRAQIQSMRAKLFQTAYGIEALEDLFL